MQSEKDLSIAVLIYLILLLFLALYNIIKDRFILDYLYFFVVLCGFIRIFVIMKRGMRK